MAKKNVTPKPSRKRPTPRRRAKTNPHKKGLGSLAIEVSVRGETYRVLTLEQLYLHMLNESITKIEKTDIDELLDDLGVVLPPECYDRLRDLLTDPEKVACAEELLGAKVTPFEARMYCHTSKVGKCYWPDCP